MSQRTIVACCRATSAMRSASASSASSLSSSTVRRSDRSFFHHYDRDYTPLYVAEAAWKYNQRRNDRAFETLLTGAVTV